MLLIDLIALLLEILFETLDVAKCCIAFLFALFSLGFKILSEVFLDLLEVLLLIPLLQEERLPSHVLPVVLLAPQLSDVRHFVDLVSHRLRDGFSSLNASLSSFGHFHFKSFQHITKFIILETSG